MSAGLKTKLLLTAVSLCLSFVYRSGGFVAGDVSVLPHFTYSFEHANVWHLLANLLVLWSVRQRMNVAAGYAIAVAASWLPMWTDRGTVGMSGLLFAVFGIMWGERGDWCGFLKAGMPVILVMMAIPGINGLLHLYCYVAGFVVFKIKDVFLKG